MCAVADGSQLHFYRNGVEEFGPFTQTVAMGGPDNPFSINRFGLYDGYFNNSLYDECYVYNRALSQAEVTALVALDSGGANYPAPIASDTLFAYSMNVRQCEDYSGNGNFGVAYNEPTFSIPALKRA